MGSTGGAQVSALTPRHGLIHPSENEKVKDLGLIAEQLAEQIDEKLTLRVGPNSAFKRATNIVMWEEQAPNLSGKILLQTNIPWGNHMFRIDFVGWEYQDMGVTDLTITGYVWDGDFSVYQMNAINKGSRQISTVEYLRNDTTGMLAIAISATSLWQYPKFAVDVWTGHIALPNSALDGWTITRVAGLTGYTVKKTVNLWWQNATLLNGWVNYDSRTAQYRKDAEGYVWLRGLVKNGAMNTAILNLPVGYRPYNRDTNEYHIPVVTADAFGHVTVASTGDITPRTGNPVWYDLGNIHFKADG
jgi:hypothetical protein